MVYRIVESTNHITNMKIELSGMMYVSYIYRLYIASFEFFFYNLPLEFILSQIHLSYLNM